MTEDMKTMQERVEELGITASYDWTSKGENDSDVWEVALTLNGRTFVTPFTMGSGHHSVEPEVAMVLDCIASDSAGYDNANGFEDWADEYGYDTDSRKAEAVYNAVKKQREEFATWAGEHYDDFVYHTDKM